MNNSPRTIRGQWLSRAIGMALLIALLLPSAVLADDATNLSVEQVQPDAVTADDGGAWELGLHGSAGNLTTATAAERAGMKYWLNNWFVTRYNFNESSAWEEDFKRAAIGGKENSYIDRVDLQFYVGHGAPGRFTFHNAAHDDSTLNASFDCSNSWGDRDNEWLALTSCQVLRSSGLSRMAQCMNRQHLILGFVSNASAHNYFRNTQAYHFGRYMRYGYNMTQAWFKGCDVAQRGRVARVIGEETACFNDNPFYSNVCADVIDNDYYWYTHSCGTESAGPTPLALMADELPVYRVDPYSLADAEEDFTDLGDIFGVPTEEAIAAAGLNEDVDPPNPPDQDSFFVSQNGGQNLELDKGSGIYQYSDLDELWNDQQIQQAMAVNAAAVNYITNDDARRIAEAFLNDNNLMPADADYYETVSDDVGTMGKDQIASASVIEEAETPAVWQVIYSRKLVAPVLMASGVTEDVEFVVVGPGAKQKVYVPITGDVNAAGVVETDPVGAQGGWRSVSPAVTAAGVQAVTTIIDEETATDLYLALDDAVTMNSIPLDIKSREVLSATVAYWESTPGSSQGELIPVYELTVLFVENETDAETEDFVYVPASSQYMAPAAQILNPPTESVHVGEEISLSAADASQTLSELGLGDFDFVMGYSGADGTYVYEWYLDSVAEENRIVDLDPNDGPRNITFQAPSRDDGHEISFDVHLVVTDIDSPNESSSSDNAEVALNPRVFLPTVNGQ